MACASAPPQVTDLDLQTATVRVATSGAHGSGVLITPDRILTAKHVVNDGNGVQETELTITFRDGHKAKATVDWNSPSADLAVLKLDDKPQPYASTNCTVAKAGAPIMTIGNPLRLTWVESRGTVASDFPYEGFTVLDLTVAPGNSGGPVFDASGKVLGVVAAMVVAPIGPFPEVVGFSLMTPVTSFCDAQPSEPNRSDTATR